MTSRARLSPCRNHGSVQPRPRAAIHATCINALPPPLHAPIARPHCTPPISGSGDLSAKRKFLAVAVAVAVAGEAGLIFAHITIPPATEGITDPDPGIFGAFQKERNARSCQHLGNHDLSPAPSCPLFQGRPRQSSTPPPIDREISD